MTSFTDDFNRADSTNLGAGWVEVSGDWSIVSSQLSPGAAGGTIILRAAGAMSSDDNFAQFTIAATTTASQGIWCRGNSTISSGYLWRNNGTSWDLFSVIGGSFTVIGTYTAAAAPGDVAKVQAVGSTIKGFVNGVQRVSVTNTGVTTGTNVGIRADSAGALRFDDFTAGDVTAGATLTIPATTETTQSLTGGKVATLSTTSAAEAAQALVGGKTLAPGIASVGETAQPLMGVKAGTLPLTSGVEAAQGLAGAKTALLSPAVEAEAAQAVGGGKASSVSAATVLESAQGPTGAKQGGLTAAEQAETARPLAGAVVPSLGLSAGIETARPLTGAKVTALGPATEVATAVHLLRPTGGRIDGYAAGTPHGRWAANRPRSAWLSAGSPRT